MRSNPVSVATAACKTHAWRAPCEHQKVVFAWCVPRVRFASRSGGESWIRTHFCVAFFKCYTEV
eukprot:10354630-Lingulodinium_polyedra.AAC.1